MIDLPSGKTTYWFIGVFLLVIFMIAAFGVSLAVKNEVAFRDDCAIRALGSLITESDLPKDQKEIDRQTKKAYRYADAMMQAKFS